MMSSEIPSIHSEKWPQIKQIEDICLLLCKMKLYFVEWALKTVFATSENAVFIAHEMK